jgi:hypothetical protein
MEGRREDPHPWGHSSPLGANFSPGGQLLPWGPTSPLGANFSPLGQLQQWWWSHFAPWAKLKTCQPWRRGIVVIVSASRTEDPGLQKLAKIAGKCDHNIDPCSPGLGFQYLGSIFSHLMRLVSPPILLNLLILSCRPPLQ